MPGQPTAGVLRLRVHLQPGAGRDRIVGRHGDALKVQVRAAPVAGAANAALLAVLADAFAVPRRAVRLVHGATSRDKLVEIHGVDAALGRERLTRLGQRRVDKA
jgi:uncharacterized protein